MALVNQQSTKRSKLTNIECVITPSVDIISNLPEHIICHILSFLPTKLSVATSILARRWRFLWTHVTSIKFESKNDGISAVSPDIVNMVFLKNTAQLNTFRFWVFKGCSEYQFKAWIHTAMERKVRVIDIHVHEFIMPQCLFISKTLVECKLFECKCLCAGDVCLPNLKKLHLSLVRYESDDSLAKLISGCLVLEELKIYCTRTGRLANLSCTAISPTLKRLSLKYAKVVKLNTPALQYLLVHNYEPIHLSAQKLSSIVEAEIHLGHYRKEEDIPYLRSVFVLVESVSTVKCLRLYCPMEMKLISTTITASTTKFRKLIKLDFQADWFLLMRILESADHLQVLIIRTVEYLNCWSEPEKVPECLLSCLRTVTFRDFRSADCDLLMVRYILRNAKFLKRMEIDLHKSVCCSGGKTDERMKNILLLPRGSEACEVAFYCNCESGF